MQLLNQLLDADKYVKSDGVMVKRLACILCFLGVVPFAVGVEGNRDQRQNAMAQAAVFWGLVGQNELADSQAELGLTVLGVKNSSDALRHLAMLIRYRMDAGLSESYHCYVANKGKKIVTYLRNIQPAELAAQCYHEFAQFKKGSPHSFEKIDESHICQTVAQIEEKKKLLVAGIRSGARCVDGDF
jgi:hypothetical protein